MPAGAKINSTIGGYGYYSPDDLDADALRRVARQSAKNDAKQKEAQGLASDSKRMTMMTPMTIVCDKCEQHIAKFTKMYANASVAPEKYLGKIKVWQLSFRCPKPNCGHKIRLLVNPKTRGYDVAEGGKSLEENLKQRDAAAAAPAAQADGDPLSAQQQDGGDDESGDGGGATLDTLASFEDIRQQLHAESEAINALGENYIDETGQVALVRESLMRRQREEAAERQQEAERERAVLHAEFEKAKSEMSSSSSSSAAAAAAAASTTHGGGGSGDRAIEALRQAHSKYGSALDDARALFIALARAPAPSITQRQPQQQQQLQHQQQPPAQPRAPKKKGSLLASLVGDES